MLDVHPRQCYRSNGKVKQCVPLGQGGHSADADASRTDASNRRDGGRLEGGNELRRSRCCRDLGFHVRWSSLHGAHVSCKEIRLEAKNVQTTRPDAMARAGGPDMQKANSSNALSAPALI
jgi:hypothetical protein